MTTVPMQPTIARDPEEPVNTIVWGSVAPCAETTIIWASGDLCDPPMPPPVPPAPVVARTLSDALAEASALARRYAGVQAVRVCRDDRGAITVVVEPTVQEER